MERKKNKEATKEINPISKLVEEGEDEDDEFDFSGSGEDDDIEGMDNVLLFEGYLYKLVDKKFENITEYEKFHDYLELESEIIMEYRYKFYKMSVEDAQRKYPYTNFKTDF